jgi:hypothetical protein
MSTPAWIEDASGTSAAGPAGGSTPSWLSDDTATNATGDLQMTTLQVDGVLEPTTIKGDGDSPAPPSSATQAARQKTWGEFWRSSFSRDGRTLLITLVIIVVMNIPYVKWALYPFTIFSTWIHELCHGLAAEMAKGNIIKLEIFPDTSGLCTFSLPNANRTAFVASAGYQGTAVIGMLLLMLRRTKRGPRAGTFAIALMMLISVCIWVRNVFGICFILGMGVLLALAAWKLPSFWIRNLYVVLGVTCTLNAITSIKALFGTNQEVNGNEVSTDAVAMADVKGGSHTMWALIWMFLALGLALLGFMFAIPGPDEVADFTICGMCQDMGCFYPCNAQGKRLFSTLFGKKEKEDNPSNATDVV